MKSLILRKLIFKVGKTVDVHILKDPEWCVSIWKYKAICLGLKSWLKWILSWRSKNIFHVENFFESADFFPDFMILVFIVFPSQNERRPEKIKLVNKSFVVGVMLNKSSNTCVRSRLNSHSPWILIYSLTSGKISTR